MKRTVIIVIIAAVLGVLVVVGAVVAKPYMTKTVNDDAVGDEHASSDMELRKFRLESELEKLDEKYDRASLGTSAIEFVFKDPYNAIYTTAYSEFDEYDCKATIGFTGDKYPGDDGCMTEEMFKEMTEDGFDHCIFFPGKAKNPAEKIAEIQDYFTSHGYKKATAIVFQDSTYNSTNLDIAKSLGFKTMVMSYNSAKKTIPEFKTDEDGYFYSIYRDYQDTSVEATRLTQIRTNGYNLVLLLSFTADTDGFSYYSQSSLHSQLNDQSSDTYGYNRSEILTLTQAAELAKNKDEDIAEWCAEITEEKNKVLQELDELNSKIAQVK